MADPGAVGGVALEPAGPCPVCAGTRRTPTYERLADLLFGTPGEWTLQRCAGCGLLLLDPRYPPEHIATAYDNYVCHLGLDPAARPWWFGAARAVARAYLARSFGYTGDLPAWQRTLAWLAVALPLTAESLGFSVMYLRRVPGGELLDIGCGGGVFLERMRGLGWRVLGVEPDLHAVEVARTIRGLDVRAGTLEQQRLPAGRFDAVTASHVIEHVHDPVALLRECGRVLKPGGRIVIVTPNTDSLGHRRLRASWLGLDPPRHLYLFSGSTLTRAAERAGLRVLSLRSSPRNAEFVWLLGRGILKEWPRPGQRPPRGLPGLRARTFQLAEWARTLAGVPAGEEIVLIATGS